MKAKEKLLNENEKRKGRGENFKNYYNYRNEKTIESIIGFQEKEHGVTVVALVITIIVLLILAGIVISMVNGANGILGRAKNAINNYKLAELDEQNIMDDYEKEIDELFKESNEPDGDDVKYKPEKDPEPETKVNGSSADWKVNEAGDTIVAYIGGPISSDTIVVPNYVDGKKIVKLGDGQMPVFLNKGDVTKGKKLKISRGIEEISNQAFCAFTNEMIGDLVIHEGTKKIGDAAFVGCSGMDGNLKMYEGLESIGTCAFNTCSKLKGDLTIPSTVATLQGGSFNRCSGLDGTLTIASKDTGSSAFGGTNFKKLVLTNKVEQISEKAFEGCNEFIGDLTIPSSVKSVPGGVFNGCTKFDGTITVGAKKIENGALSGLHFKKIVIKNTVETIGSGAFAGCSELEGNLAIPSGVKTVGGGAFGGCTSLKGILAIGANTIEPGAFQGTNLTQLLFANTVNIIGDGAFMNCESLTGNLIIPNSVTSIGNSSFANCTGFTGDLLIPSSVETIVGGAFNDCSGFSGTLTVGMKNIPGTGLFTSTKFSRLVIESTVETISDDGGAHGAFKGMNLTSGMEIRNGITTIGTNAFNSIKITGDLVIPNSVTTINGGAFVGISIDGNMIVPSSITFLGKYAFDWIKTTKDTGTITIGIQDIPNEAFLVEFKKTIFSDTVQKIGEGQSAFGGCSLGTVTFSEGIKEIEANAFSGVSFSGELRIPKSVTIIRSKAFSGSNGITKVILENKTTEIASDAFPEGITIEYSK